MESVASSSSSEHPKKRALSFWIRRILVITLASIGAVTIGAICIVAGVAGLLGIFSDGKPTIVSITPSPNGKYKAMEVAYAGGGGISPFCNYAILVGPASSQDDVAKYEKRNEVFSADCSSDPSVEWLSNDRLRVAFSAVSGAHYLKKIDATGSVQVNFVARQ
jgi:hypothetical protein